LVCFSLYLGGIQDVGVFVFAVVSIFKILGQTVRVYQSYNGGLWGPPCTEMSSTERACIEKSKLNII